MSELELVLVLTLWVGGCVGIGWLLIRRTSSGREQNWEQQDQSSEALGTGSVAAIKTRIEATVVAPLATTVHRLDVRNGTLEQRLGSLERRVGELEAQLQEAHETITQLKALPKPVPAPPGYWWQRLWIWVWTRAAATGPPGGRRRTHPRTVLSPGQTRPGGTGPNSR